MDKGTTYVALDDSKRKIVAGILRADDTWNRSHSS